MITLDGKQYKATWLQGLEQTADIMNGENSGRLQTTGKMHLEYLGTFFNHKGQLRRDANCTDAEWDALFRALANPVNKHVGTFPFEEDKVLEQEVYISQLQRKPKHVEIINGKEYVYWNSVLAVTFTAISPAWLPGGTIRGLK